MVIVPIQMSPESIRSAARAQGARTMKPNHASGWREDRVRRAGTETGSRFKDFALFIHPVQ